MFYQKLVMIGAVFFVVQCCALNSEECPNVKTSLKAIRKRRYLTFPDKSDVVITISLAKTFLTHVPSGWIMISDLNVMYPLPNTSFSRMKHHHRQKRQLWERIMNAFDLHNMNGQECLLRSICEGNRYLAPKGKSLVHDLLRAIFTVPMQEKFLEEMGGVKDDLKDPNFCDRIPDCPMSLIHFLLDLNKS